MQQQKDKFTRFKGSIDTISLPEKFTFPFYYTPHPLSRLATKELQDHLKTQIEWEHNFDLDGKMFGVLVVKNLLNEIGYLAAFSGKLADKNHHSNFVPPVFDMLKENNFFNKGMLAFNKINDTVKLLENDPEYLRSKEFLNKETLIASQEIEQLRESMRQAKKARKISRAQGEIRLSIEKFQSLKEVLIRESLRYKHQLNVLTKSWKEKLSNDQKKLAFYQNEIEILKEKRKNHSADLQQEIFEKYRFLNTKGELKNLSEIFIETPPKAGAGECAAPKLLQYAFLQNLKPIAMAEFWWGTPPKSQIRKHGNFYPSCRGKCEPILGHMLAGIEMDENPLLKNPAIGKIIKTVFEDEYLVVINKPTELLSVPGKNIEDSVAFRMKKKYPDATGPLIVHRLDMSTSGLMLIAKSAEIHKILQSQFIKHTIKKRYVALLNGTLERHEGIINLPLRVDLNDRPRQLVCHKWGKSAQTKWKIISRKNKQTKVHFSPVTGRTHQLRMHAAHSEGLNMPIVGDDLYGTKSSRLHLHAEFLEFIHPISKKIMTIQVEADF